jgi:hypothetical protein
VIDCGFIAQALAAYDPDAHEASILKAEEQRAEFVSRFPKERWQGMTLDRYALGQAEHPDNFCRWLEFVTTELGSMKGGSARKHLIYFQAATGEWWFDRKAFENVDEAWEAVHKGFVDAIALAEAGDWQRIEDIAALRSGRALLNKTLSIYFPDELLPINSQAHLRHFLRQLGEPKADDQGLGTTSLNRVLLEGLRTCTELDGWTTKQMERLLYASDLDPFKAQAPAGPIADVAAFIAQTLEEAGTDRLELRRQTEDEARKLLDEFAGKMSPEQVRKLFKLFNADFHNGKRVDTRFSPAFVGQTANALVGNLEKFNSWTARVWTGARLRPRRRRRAPLRSQDPALGGNLVPNHADVPPQPGNRGCLAAHHRSRTSAANGLQADQESGKRWPG